MLSIAALLGVSAVFAQTPSPTPEKPPAPAAPSLTLNDISVKFEELVNRIRPSVVQIFSTGYVTSGDSESGNALRVAMSRISNVPVRSPPCFTS